MGGRGRIAGCLISAQFAHCLRVVTLCCRREALGRSLLEALERLGAWAGAKGASWCTEAKAAEAADEVGAASLGSDGLPMGAVGAAARGAQRELACRTRAIRRGRGSNSCGGPSGDARCGHGLRGKLNDFGGGGEAARAVRCFGGALRGKGAAAGHQQRTLQAARAAHTLKATQPLAFKAAGSTKAFKRCNVTEVTVLEVILPENAAEEAVNAGLVLLHLPGGIPVNRAARRGGVHAGSDA